MDGGEELLWKEPVRKPDTRPLGERIRSLTVRILEDLWDVANDMGELMLDRKAVYRRAYGGVAQGWSYSRYSNRFDNLHKRGYLEYRDHDGGRSVVFTNKAKLKILDKIRESFINDEKYRFVSFDIPEPLRKSRDAFRRAIKQLGFRQIQKSLWVTNRNVSNFVEMAAYEFGVEHYVVYIVSEKTDIDGLISKMFTLGKKSISR